MLPTIKDTTDRLQFLNLLRRYSWTPMIANKLAKGNVPMHVLIPLLFGQIVIIMSQYILEWKGRK